MLLEVKTAGKMHCGKRLFIGHIRNFSPPVSIDTSPLGVTTSQGPCLQS